MKKRIIAVIAAASVIGWCALVARQVVKSLLSTESATEDGLPEDEAGDAADSEGGLAD